MSVYHRIFLYTRPSSRLDGNVVHVCEYIHSLTAYLFLFDAVSSCKANRRAE